MGFEDLERIIPDQLKSVASRKVYVVLGAVILLLVVCCLALSILVLVQHGGSQGQTMDGSAAAALTLQKHFCLTPACLHTASHVLHYMDTTTPPCEDFHRHACGNWARSYGLPPDHPSMNVWRVMYDKNEERLRELIESPIRHDTPDSAERKLKDFFRSCVHDYGRMRQAGATLAEIIRTRLGGWYALNPDEFSKNDWDFHQAVERMHADYLIPVLFKVRIVYDRRGSKGQRYRQNMPGIRYGGMGMSFYNYHQDDRSAVRESYQDMMREMGVFLLRDANVTLDESSRAERIEQFVTDAFDIELGLADLMKQARRLPRYWRSRRVQLRGLVQNITQIKWDDVLNGYFEHADISQRTVVRVDYFQYFMVFEQWMKNLTQNASEFKRKMNNYIVWRLLDTLSPNLSWEYKNAGYRFYEAVSGVREFPPTWEECLDQASEKLGTIVSAEYIRTHLPKSSVDKVSDIAKYTKVALLETLDELPWMDNTTRARAKDKVGQIEIHVAFADTFLKDDFLDELHAKVDISRDYSYLQNLLNLNAYQKVIHAKQLQAGEAYYMWRAAIGGVTRVYPSLYWRSNMLVIPAGSIQYPLFDSYAPRFHNFGTLGGYVAEMMVKSIGEMGRYVWTNGTFMNWWSDTTYKNYMKERSCMEDHFNNITVGPFLIDGVNKTVKVNGRYQSWQAVDDMAGIKAAFRAYEKWVSDNGPETIPVGMNVTVDQAFFIANAQTRCYIRTPLNAYNFARWYYIPEDVMLNSVLAHTGPFKDAFQCAPDTKMGVTDQCEVF